MNPRAVAGGEEGSPMQLIEDLQADHELIEQVLGSLRAFVTARMEGRGDPADGPVFMEFFRLFAGNYHHAREEEVLFRALCEQAELPAERGPIAALTNEHRRMGEVLEAMAVLMEDPLTAPEPRLQALAVDFSRSLWHHIDAENSVMFPEGQEHLRQFNVKELAARPMTQAEAAAREAGAALVAVYPPQEDLDFQRGDGCIHCPSYNTTCDGLEREWWTEHVWADFNERMSSD
jgi:hemerythrin-like domain-containing protein